MDDTREMDVYILADSQLNHQFDVRPPYSEPPGLYDGAAESVWDVRTWHNIATGILCQDSQGLLTRLPGLERYWLLTMVDGTPFADEVTLNWVHQQVLVEENGWRTGQTDTATLTDDDIIRLEPEVLEKADSDGLEQALNWLQARPGITSMRDQWPMCLLMARVTEPYGKNNMSLHLLGEQCITLPLWMPELILEVKPDALNCCVQKPGVADKTRLQAEMDKLLSRLISLDPARAAVLCG